MTFWSLSIEPQDYNQDPFYDNRRSPAEHCLRERFNDHIDFKGLCCYSVFLNRVSCLKICQCFCSFHLVFHSGLKGSTNLVESMANGKETAAPDHFRRRHVLCARGPP